VARLDAVICVSEITNAEEPKRRNEIQLDMTSVALYTDEQKAPSAGSGSGSGEGEGEEEESKGEVHWVPYSAGGFDRSSKGHDLMLRAASASSNVSVPGQNSSNGMHMMGAGSLGDGSGSGLGGIGVGGAGSGMLSSGMKIAVRDFNLSANYTFYSDITVAEAAHMNIARHKEVLQSAFKLDIPEFALELEAEQFSLFLSVLNEVMLAPPPRFLTDSSDGLLGTMDRMKRAQKSMSIPYRRPAGEKGDLDVSNAAKLSAIGPEMVRLVEKWMVGELGDELKVQPNMSRSNEVYLGKGSWLLKAGPGQPDVMKVTFAGLNAVHSFHANECTSTSLEVQRFFVTARNQGGDGASSGQQGAGKYHGNHGSSFSHGWEQEPILSVAADDEACCKCGEQFTDHDNHSMACLFHDDGVGLCQYDSTRERWPCCGARERGAMGCKGRPHQYKEMMVSVRAESFPAASVENVDLSVMSSLTVSIFPEANYALKVHLTRQLQQDFNDYFNIKLDEKVTNERAKAAAKAMKGGSQGKSKLKFGWWGSDREKDIGGVDRSIVLNNVDAIGEDHENPLLRRANSSVNGSGSLDISTHTTGAPVGAGIETCSGGQPAGGGGGGVHDPDMIDLGPVPSLEAIAASTGTPGGAGAMRKTLHRQSITFSTGQGQGSSSGITGSGSDRAPGAMAIGRSASVLMHRPKKPSREMSSIAATALALNQAEAARLALVHTHRSSSKKKSKIKAKTKRYESIYIKYIRASDINLELSMAGFSLLPSLEKARLHMEPWVSHSHLVMNWQQLVTDFTGHCVLNVGKNYMSGWGVRIYRMLAGGEEDKEKKKDEEAKRRFLLGHR